MRNLFAAWLLGRERVKAEPTPWHGTTNSKQQTYTMDTSQKNDTRSKRTGTSFLLVLTKVEFEGKPLITSSQKKLN